MARPIGEELGEHEHCGRARLRLANSKLPGLEGLAVFGGGQAHTEPDCVPVVPLSNLGRERGGRGKRGRRVHRSVQGLEGSRGGTGELCPGVWAGGITLESEGSIYGVNKKRRGLHVR